MLLSAVAAGIHVTTGNQSRKDFRSSVRIMADTGRQLVRIVSGQNASVINMTHDYIII